MDSHLCSKHYNKDVRYINKLVQLLYDDLQEHCGGLLHITIDDGNLDDEDIQWCIEYCNKNENSDREDKYLCLEIATRMLRLTMEQRKLVYYMNGRFSCEGDCGECVIERGEEDV